MRAKLRGWAALCCSLVVAVGGSGCASIREALPGLARGERGASLKVAILPLAYRDERGVVECDLCPDRLVMAPTSREDALLVTAFFYEVLDSHPRFVLVEEGRVEAARGATMAETMRNLRAREGVDAVLVGALLELRARMGDPRAPGRRAGAAVYAALIDSASQAAIWRGYRDWDDRAPARWQQGFTRVVRGATRVSKTALEVAREAVESLVEDMVRKVR
ncbi:MAG: hypothetical protein D6815_07765 [Candidatus Dadabacteria bacterium]|nr:MAG: hypothetical protein D6815_07765 [Candidatus Dadabacteria bacterium]